MPLPIRFLAPLVLLLAVPWSVHGLAEHNAGEHAVEQFLAGDGIPLVSYEAVRTLEASTRGGSMQARLVARTSDDPVHGFRYTVLEETGSAVIRTHVLHAALDGERDMRARGEFTTNALSRANYQFGEPEPEADGTLRVRIQPTRKDAMLVDGSIALTVDGDLLRVDGTLVKRPSFWTRRVDIVREYARLLGVRVPVRMQSTARVLIVGESRFAMSYRYESINGRAVDTPAPSTAERNETSAHGAMASLYAAR